MRLFQPTYTRDGKTFKSDVWWCAFVVKDRHFRESTGLRDPQAATVAAADRLREEELRAAGIETFAGTTRATLAGLLDEYRADMARRGLAPKHVETTLARCSALVEGVANMAALTTTVVQLALDRLRGCSAKTVNGYRTALHGFCEWLVKGGRWGSNPVTPVKRSRETADGPARRALTPAEQDRLLSACDPDHRNAYIIALSTGLRRAEIASLGSTDILLGEDGRYSVRLRGAAAKNRKEATLPLPKGVSLARAGRLAPPSMRGFRRDLKAAGIDPEGVDFHALRVTFATNLARSGVPLALAQRLMRHSTPALTSNIYTRLRLDDEEAAVDGSVPDYLKSEALARGAAAHAVPPAGLPAADPYAGCECDTCQPPRAAVS